MSITLVFLKLGGSLITEKSKVSTPRPEVIASLVKEIVATRVANPDLRIVLGHGSGSFGHVPAKKHGTRAGVHTPAGWAGFIEVWQQAAALNRIVVDSLLAGTLPAFTVPPSATVTARDGVVQNWELAPIRSALQAGLLPVIYGDVVFDSVRGGTILSTEDLFAHLAKALSPQRILLAGDERGIFADYPERKQPIEEITPATYANYAGTLNGSTATDVTGGMAGKVQAMLALVGRHPNCEVQIFSGMEPGNVQRALQGERFGTILRSQE